jgi:2-aminoadipate transaminase
VQNTVINSDILYSQAAQHLQRSVMRDLIKRTADPEIIALSGGLPDSQLLPVAQLQDCITTVLKREGGDALQYRPPYPPLVEWINRWMTARGVRCTPEQIFITNGNQQGLTILSRLLLDPGDPAITEAVTFTGIQQVTAGRGAIVRPVRTDLETGVDLKSLSHALQTEPRPRLAVLIPDFHNPLGVSITAEKRAQVAQMVARHRVPLVEDDPYSALRFDGEPVPPIKAYDQHEMVFYMGSFSKMLAPAARLGWMVAPAALVPRLTVIRESIDLESSALMQRAVAEYLQRGLLDEHLARLNATNRTRRDALLAALADHLEDVATWTEPDGGLFVWLTLHDPAINTWDLFETAITQAKVAFIPGGAFALVDGYQHTMRLNFSKVTPDQITDGVRRLAQVIKQTT